MSTDNISVDRRVSSDDELDGLFDALAHPLRRAVVDELEEGVPTALDELVARVSERRELRSETVTQLTFVHCHLPKLDDAGVVDYDPDEQRCTLNDARVVRSMLAAARIDE